MSPWCLDGSTVGVWRNTFIDLEQVFGIGHRDRMPRLNYVSEEMIMLLFCGEFDRTRRAPREELDESGLDILDGRTAASHGAGAGRSGARAGGRGGADDRGATFPAAY